jgi:hypothetical protein
MPVPGVILPDLKNGYADSWGFIEGTKIGYIYISSTAGSWMISSGSGFATAINTFMNDPDVDGLIIDNRMDEGGDHLPLRAGLSMLFNENQHILAFDVRSDPNNHFTMSFDRDLSFGADNQLFDKPIAMITGPAAVSMGDWLLLLLKKHPMSRLFGLPTNGAFGWARAEESTSAPGWELEYTFRNGYLTDKPGEYLNHLGVMVDEEIWLTQEDVVKGEDTVVKRAMEWINNLAYAHNVKVDPPYVKPMTDSTTITAIVENPNHHDLSVMAIVTDQDTTVVDSFYLFNDGNHNDGAAGDSIWGAFKLPVNIEQNYQISVKTEDPVSNTSRTLPLVGHFTSIGPVVFENFIIDTEDSTANPGDALNIKLTLSNLSLNSIAEEIKARIISLDTLATITRDIEAYFVNLDPGESFTSFGRFGITISENCPVNIKIPFRVDISSNDHYFWSDTFSIRVEQPVGISEQIHTTPKEFAFYQNYPNPFNPTTTIEFSLPAEVDVVLEIYNTTGQLVETLVNKRMRIGHYNINWDASNMPSGLYFYKIKAGSFTDLKKMILLR